MIRKAVKSLHRSYAEAAGTMRYKTQKKVTETLQRCLKEEKDHGKSFIQQSGSP